MRPMISSLMLLGKSSFHVVKVAKQNGRYLLASFKMRHSFKCLDFNGSGKKVICALHQEVLKI